jgi:acetoin utilization protein AcuB
MAIKDFMTKDVITVTPDTKISQASEIMDKHDVHRLPVMDGEKLVGLVTEGTIQAASPSKATSLSVYEMNYLLNKTVVSDVMIKKVLTVTPDAVLEDGIYEMRSNNVGVLPVLEGDKLVGIITDKDIFDAFLKISGYGEDGSRITIAVKHNETGDLALITKLLADKGIDITTLIVNPTGNDGQPLIELQVKSDAATARTAFEGTPVTVLNIVETTGKK